MAKHIQTIRRQQPTICLNVFEYFVVLTRKGLSCPKSFKFLPKQVAISTILEVQDKF